ncbi:penicillin-binding protein 1A [Arboricoccus pini]|uniref:Penicillin-binding protein 1A n=1 Tax=Arboricoccus pini TaxID=1963835 RepID=A0A212QZ32_9PROT|nr:PBP1A family penicillin-binding protein [Arboricoccus pini]SNB64980.1 penicillin-binding protein 1A [Arboricoccus pini]
MAAVPTLMVVAMIVWVVTFAIYAPSLPDTDALMAVRDEPVITILAADDTPIAQRVTGGRRFVPLDEISPLLVKAVVATEDSRFWQHFGIDPIGIARAFVTNMTSGSVSEGGSTITQQLAKILFLTPERSLKRKLEEATLAIWLEARLSKKDILALYLNKVYLGAGAYGVEAASRRYFAKPASALNLAEAAMIAGLLKAPSALAPTNDLQGARDRADTVLGRMVAVGYITEDQMLAARARPARLSTEGSDDLGSAFVAWVLDGLIAYMGKPTHDIKIATTLDPKLQKSADRAVRQALASDGPKLDVNQGAAVLLRDDGAVVAMVGGEGTRGDGFNRAVAARRQPGSAFKPFLYLAAMEAGFTPSTIVLDGPIKIGNWTPQNYDNHYRGEVTLAKAFAESLNVPAARVIREVGPDKVVEVAHRLGIASAIQSVPSIALGTSETTLIELTGAYLPFATGGITNAIYAVRRVTDDRGKVLYRNEPAPRRVIEPGPAEAMRSMMQGVVEDGTGRAVAMPGRIVAGKTGTTQNSRDAWFVGWSGDYVLGVWVGNDDNTPMRGVTGGGMPARIWRSIMSATPAPASAPSVREPPVATAPASKTGPLDLARRGANWLNQLVDRALE